MTNIHKEDLNSSFTERQTSLVSFHTSSVRPVIGHTNSWPVTLGLTAISMIVSSQQVGMVNYETLRHSARRSCRHSSRAGMEWGEYRTAWCVTTARTAWTQVMRTSVSIPLALAAGSLNVSTCRSATQHRDKQRLAHLCYFYIEINKKTFSHLLFLSIILRKLGSHVRITFDFTDIPP